MCFWVFLCVSHVQRLSFISSESFSRHKLLVELEFEKLHENLNHDFQTVAVCTYFCIILKILRALSLQCHFLCFFSCKLLLCFGTLVFFWLQIVIYSLELDVFSDKGPAARSSCTVESVKDDMFRFPRFATHFPHGDGRFLPRSRQLS